MRPERVVRETIRRSSRSGWPWAFVIALIVVGATPANAADFACPSGDVSCLTSAVLAANANGEVNTVTLEAGLYTLTASGYFIPGDGIYGLPSVTGTLTIRGSAMGTTTIDHAQKHPFPGRVSILHVSSGGSLTIERLIINRGGNGIVNRGTLTVVRSTVSDSFNEESSGGGGMKNIEGTVFLFDATVVRNTSFYGGGGLLNDGGTVFVVNSTVANNGAGGRFGGGGLSNFNGGTAVFLHSTVSGNGATMGGGIENGSGTVTLQNTVLAGNTAPTGADCFGAITSLGTNVIGNPAGCTVPLLPSDRTGNAGLSPYTEDARPGSGHFSPLANSPVIDAASDVGCLRYDQLQQPRTRACDIGSIESRGAVLTVDPTEVQVGGFLTVTWDGIANPTATDWIGLFAPGSDNFSFIDWMYVSCTWPADVPRASGSCPFAVPASLAAGSYELRLLANDGFADVIATSEAVAVTR